jgi:hypothetical protein
MDDTRFDELIKSLEAGRSRRATLRALGLAAVAALGRFGFDATAKHKGGGKKKCKKPNIPCGAKGCCTAGTQVCVNDTCLAACHFTKTATKWTLQADCGTTSTITIPDGVTLDGKGKTIHLVGRISHYAFAGGNGLSAGLLIKDGTVTIRNLTLSERIQGCSAGGMFEIMFFHASGRVETSTITQDRHASLEEGLCAEAIAVFGVGGESVDVDDVIISSNFNTDGVLFRGLVTGSVTNSTIKNKGYAVTADSGATATVEGNTLNPVAHGVFDEGSGTIVTVKTNTIVGPDDDDGGSTGVDFSNDAAGEISGNAISNYLTNCGIRIFAGAGDVTIGDNTFPDPGNEQDICDFRQP